MKSSLRLVLVFSIAFSLASLSGPISTSFRLPTLQLAHANSERCQIVMTVCSYPWIPAGPEMDTETVSIFADGIVEYSNLLSPTPTIDFPDTPCTPAICQSLTINQNFLVTSPVPETGYREIQFLLANTFWGCNFNFGNSACGIQIRQGIAHMMDKSLFATTESSDVTSPTALDNPVPTNSIGNLPSPNPCGWDSNFTQIGVNCIQGAPGGTSYHLAAAAGANGFPWLQAPGSLDLNAAAQHFVNAGLATGFNPTTSILTGISNTATNSIPTFFIRNDDPVRLHLGQGLAEQICYLFTGSYAAPCQFLSIVLGNINIMFPGIPGTTGIRLNWWIYTAAYTDVTFFDSSLYYTYNSRFVSGVPSSQPPCSPQAVPTSSAADYMYLCSPTYDSLSSKMESDTTLAQAVTDGISAENYFGSNSFTIPVLEPSVQFAYPNTGWIRDINDAQVGLPNYFTWLNAYNPTPAIPSTIRQGFAETTQSVNPFIASTQRDLYIVGNVYDSLHINNPLSPGQSINWMTSDTVQRAPGTEGYPTGITAPPGTLTTYRFFLRPDMYFQDGTPVTAWDVAFSYLNLVASGAFLGTGAAAMTGITVVNKIQIDIGVNSLGPFVLPAITSLPIMPARYWTSLGSSAWDAATFKCTVASECHILFGTGSQYTLSGSTINCVTNPLLSCTPFGANLMTVASDHTAATFDPIAARNFVGSGPWQCGTTSTQGSGTCSTSGRQNPPVGGGYTLTRFGKGLSPASSLSGIYFRSSANAAIYLWSEANNIAPNAPLSEVNGCAFLPVNPLSSCYHWQQGAGSPNFLSGGAATPVMSEQTSIESRFYDISWVQPFSWPVNPPSGIVAADPVLYDGTFTLTPAPSPLACAPPNPPNVYYDC